MVATTTDRPTRRRSFVLVAATLVAALLVAACAGGGSHEAPEPSLGVDARGQPIPQPPPVPRGTLEDAVADDVDLLMEHATSFGLDRPLVIRVGEAEDARLAWLLVDLMRVFQGEDDTGFLVDAFESLTGSAVRSRPAFREASDLLIAWDLPAPPGYAERKAVLLEALEPEWEPFFDDAGATVDWRHVAWGGVWADTRSRQGAAAGDRCARGCVPALDDPAVTSADDGYWLQPERPVFGVVVEGEARAYPVHVLEAHEIVNDTLGGRRIALTFCTLCRSAQAFLVDEVPDAVRDDVGSGPLVLRTSGLLQRSNKLSFELATRSLIETFTGRALSGPLREADVVLEQVSVVTSSWGAWRTAHRDTTIVARDGGIGRAYRFDPLGDRDADGPIFGVGDVDPRLPVQDLVLGAVAPDGTAIAFPLAALRVETQADRPVASHGVRVMVDGDGFRVVTSDGAPVVGHEAFWFAWSQFHPDSEVWAPE